MAGRTKVDLEELSDEELEAENQRLMAERAEIEESYKAQQMVVQAEVTRRSDAAAIERLLGSLSDEARDELRAQLGEG